MSIWRPSSLFTRKYQVDPLSKHFDMSFNDYAARKCCSEWNKCTSFEAMLNLYIKWKNLTIQCWRAVFLQAIPADSWPLPAFSRSRCTRSTSIGQFNFDLQMDSGFNDMANAIPFLQIYKKISIVLKMLPKRDESRLYIAYKMALNWQDMIGVIQGVLLNGCVKCSIRIFLCIRRTTLYTFQGDLNRDHYFF